MASFEKLRGAMVRIFEFAKVADWEDRLNNLAEIAEPERWHNLHVPSTQRLPILDMYLKHTFIRVFDQQKIVEAEQLACFNTGLLSRSGHEEIFGVFTVSETYDRCQPISSENKKWWLKSWARAGDRLLMDFIELPALADYWNDSRELIFDPKLQVQPNVDHIVTDNLHRFPEELGGRVNRAGIPTDLVAQGGDEEIEIESPPGNQEVPLATRNALEGAMRHSIQLAKRSYRIGVPQFSEAKYNYCFHFICVTRVARTLL